MYHTSLFPVFHAFSKLETFIANLFQQADRRVLRAICWYDTLMELWATIYAVWENFVYPIFSLTSKPGRFLLLSFLAFIKVESLVICCDFHHIIWIKLSEILMIKCAI